jgi:membrane-bound lytic murein transglycosylase D
MRLIISVLLAMLLTACANTRTGIVNDVSTIARTPADAVNAATNQAIRLNQIPATALAPKPGDMAETAEVSDIWQSIRQRFQMPDIKNALVQKHLATYTSRPDYVQRMTERASRYLYHVVNALEARNMPSELALLPFIESSYNPQALSAAKASGLWQFIPSTGDLHQLRRNIFQDERRDILASTDAALNYLWQLYEKFGDWPLALAAYNWGAGNVQRAIVRNHAAGLGTDYLSLKLPDETRNYVPKLQAMKQIIADPDQYQQTLAPIPNRPYFAVVTTAHDIDIKVAAQLAELPLSEFSALNPSYLKPIIPGATQPHILLPFENAQTFETNLNAYDGRLSSWTAHTVIKRERPAVLAKRMGLAAQTLVAVNKIPAGMRLKPGATILVPKSSQTKDISAYIVRHAVLAIEPDILPRRRTNIRVRPRDTLSVLARRHRVSVAQIKTWNNIRGTKLIAGQMLKLHPAPANRKVSAVKRAAQRKTRRAYSSTRATRKR